MFKSIFAEEINVFVKTKLNNELQFLSYLCLVSLKFPFNMQTLGSLMLCTSALKCNGREETFSV